MTIDEAILILEEMLKPSNPYWIQDYVDAMLLGIEALKAWKQFREGRWLSGQYTLPGETEEGK